MGKNDEINEKQENKDKNENKKLLSDLSMKSARSQDGKESSAESQKILKSNISDRYSSFKDGDKMTLPSPSTEKELEKKKGTEEVLKDILFEEEQGKKIRETNEETGGPSARNISFDKKNIIRREVFSFGNLDVYLHYQYRHVNVAYRCLIECILVVIMFMFFPVLLIALKNFKDGRGLFQKIPHQRGNPNRIMDFFKSNLFLSLAYLVFIFVSLIADRILMFSAFVLQILGIEIHGKLAEWLQIISTSRHHLRNSAFSMILFYLSTLLLAPYKFFLKKRSMLYLSTTAFFWYGALSGVMFAEKLLMNYLTSELRRKTFKTRILEANCHSFVFVKLAAIAEASGIGANAVNEVIRTYNNDYDIGFFLKYGELDLTSEKRAEIIAGGILGLLGINELSYEAIKTYFPGSSREVYTYLSGKELEQGQNEFTPIGLEELRQRSLELFQERSDIARSLYYRDMVLRKLDAILISIVLIFGILAYMMLVKVDYQIYLTSIGPTCVGFGWIFKDTIKEIYNCFVFLLANHPYDCGDRVVIDKEELTVFSIDLLFSTFITSTGKTKYIPNASMFLKPIENIRRSSIQCEKVAIRMSRNTQYSSIINIRNELSTFLKENSNDFTGNIIITNFEDIGDQMKVIFMIEHNSNFQDIKPMFKRRGMYTEALEKILDRNGCSHDKVFEYSS